VTARLEIDIQGAPARALPGGAQGLTFGVRPSRPPVVSLSHDTASRNDHRADERVGNGISHPSDGEFERSSHVYDIVLHFKNSPNLQ
jgi:hypothetical protein